MKILKRWIVQIVEEAMRDFGRERFAKIEISLEKTSKDIKNVKEKIEALKESLKEREGKLLENLKEKERSQKRLAFLLDWENLYINLKERKFEFPGKRLIEEATLVFEKQSIANLAFCEGYLSLGTRNLLERSGFTVIWSQKADEAILEWLRNLVISHSLINTILLFTHDKRLIAKVELLLSQVPKKELIVIELKGNVLKDKEGKYQVKLYPGAGKIPEVLENRFIGIAKSIREKRLFEPERDLYDKFFLLVTYSLSKIPRQGYRRGFKNIVDVVYNTYLYPNPKVRENPYLLEIATKQNLRLVLEALLEETDFLKKRSNGHNYYLINLDSQFYREIAPWFEKIKEYF